MKQALSITVLLSALALTACQKKETVVVPSPGATAAPASSDMSKPADTGASSTATPAEPKK